MKKKIYAVMLVFVSLIIAGLIVKYSIVSQKHVHSENCFSVVCTTGFIADLVCVLGGNRVQVYALMGPGVDPHLYHVREGDVKRLYEADMIMYHGLHLEGKMGHVFESMKSHKVVYAVTDALDKALLRSSGFSDLFDPHIWFDVALWMRVAQGVCSMLSKHDVLYKDYYHKRLIEYLGKLKDLDEYIKNQVQFIPDNKRILITAHDAYEYFGQAYGFTVVGLQGISTESYVSTGDVKRLVQIIVDHDIPVIFAEASIPVRNIEAVQKAVEARGKQVVIGPQLYSDALGPQGSVADNYIGMMQYTIDTLVALLV